VTSEPTRDVLPLSSDADDSADSPQRVGAIAEMVRERPGSAARMIQRAQAFEALITARRQRLAELRLVVGLTQRQVAARLGVSQPDSSKLEARDMFMVDTLARFVAATGGHLRLLAEYDDGSVVELTLTEDHA
jgi:DNA-directed RNA polymerase specialized sigma subunit